MQDDTYSGDSAQSRLQSVFKIRQRLFEIPLVRERHKHRTHKRARARTHIHENRHIHRSAHARTHTHTHTKTETYKRAPACTHTHTLSLFHTHTRARTHTHRVSTLTRMHTYGWFVVIDSDGKVVGDLTMLAVQTSICGSPFIVWDWRQLTVMFPGDVSRSC